MNHQSSMSDSSQYHPSITDTHSNYALPSLIFRSFVLCCQQGTEVTPQPPPFHAIYLHELPPHGPCPRWRGSSQFCHQPQRGLSMLMDSCRSPGQIGYFGLNSAINISLMHRPTAVERCAPLAAAADGYCHRSLKVDHSRGGFRQTYCHANLYC